MNKQPLTTEQSAALEKAQQLFSNWRKSKTGRSRIPDNLWQTAADLYHIQGMSINKIARGLRLNHTVLKEKIFDMPPAAIDLPADDESPIFIEGASLPECANCVIEIENQTGIKMRMCFNGRVDAQHVLKTGLSMKNLLVAQEKMCFGLILRGKRSECMKSALTLKKP